MLIFFQNKVTMTITNESFHIVDFHINLKKQQYLNLF